MDQRLTDLEVKVSFLENEIAELDGVVRQVAEHLVAMREDLVTLRAQIREAPSSEGPASLEEERPPHY